MSKMVDALRILLVAHCAAALCTDRFATDVTDNLNDAKTLAHQRQALVPYMQFTCNGRITRLTISTEDQSGKPHYGQNPVTFQMWQPTGSTTYRLVGQVELPEGVTLSGNDLLVNFSIPTGLDLFFHHSDVIGYFQPDDLREKILNDDNDNSYFAYELNTNTIATTFDVSSRSVSRRNSRKPLVKVTHEPVCVRPSLSTVTDCHPSDDTGSLIAINGTCMFSCEIGYKPQGSNGTVQCLPSGSWSNEAVCVMIQCPSFVTSSPLIDFNCNGSTYNSICMLQCLSGASPNGNPRYVCGNGSTWEPLGDEFTCTEIPASSTISVTTSLEATSSTVSVVTLAVASNVSSLVSATPTSPGEKDTSNRGAIAGGVVAAIVFLGLLLALVVILLWIYYKRSSRLFYFQRLIPVGERSKDNMKKESREENIYCSINQDDMVKPLLATIYDVIESDHNQESATCKEIAPKLPPKRPSVKSKSLPIVDDSSEYEFMSVSANQVVAIAYSKNIVHWRKLVKTSQSKYCRPYEVPSVLVEDIYEDPGTAKEKIYAYFERKRFRKILSRDLRVEEEIGSGEFGTVHKGKWNNDISNMLAVAIKTFNSTGSESDKTRFLREAAIMGQFLHDNIVQLHGVVTEENIMIVLEYMPKGDLQGLLLLQIRSSKDQLDSVGLPDKLLKFSRQIAAGMNYLTNKRFVHRDLAARNILVSSDDVCKIADFGMARDVTTNTYYVTSGGKLPVKWTAPEALLYHKYSVFSDIWSYGCVLYEIWSIGHVPFEDTAGDIALEKLSYGYRLPPPPGCPKGIYELMIDCWHGDPKGRPPFNVILAYLNGDLTDLLSWGTDDLEAAANSDVVKLGAPLSSGNNLYLTLQNIYRF